MGTLQATFSIPYPLFSFKKRDTVHRPCRRPPPPPLIAGVFISEQPNNNTTCLISVYSHVR